MVVVAVGAFVLLVVARLVVLVGVGRELLELGPRGSQLSARGVDQFQCFAEWARMQMISKRSS